MDGSPVLHKFATEALRAPAIRSGWICSEAGYGANAVCMKLKGESRFAPARRFTVSSAALTASSSVMFVESSKKASGAGLRGESDRFRSRSSRARRSRMTSSGCRGRFGAVLAYLIVSAHTAHFRRGIEEDLHLCIRKDYGPNVAPFHDYAALGTHLLLSTDHGGADGRKNTHARCRVGYGLIPDLACNIFPIKENAVFFLSRLKID